MKCKCGGIESDLIHSPWNRELYHPFELVGDAPSPINIIDELRKGLEAQPTAGTPLIDKVLDVMSFGASQAHEEPPDKEFFANEIFGSLPLGMKVQKESESIAMNAAIAIVEKMNKLRCAPPYQPSRVVSKPPCHVCGEPMKVKEWICKCGATTGCSEPSEGEQQCHICGSSMVRCSDTSLRGNHLKCISCGATSVCEPAPESTREPEGDERIAEIAERCEKATKGPWVRWEEHPTVFCGNEGGTNSPGAIVGNQICECEPDDLPDIPGTDPDEDAELYIRQAEDNAEFLAHARMDIPYLLERVRALREERDWMARLIDSDL